MDKLKEIKVKRLINTIDKINGLIGVKKIRPVYFETRFGIHTYGMKKEIVVITLDRNNIIRAIKPVKPNCVYFWNPKFSRIIELPVKKYKFKVGDKITLKFIN